MTTKAPTPQEAIEKLHEKTQGTRIQVLRFLSMIGAALAGIGSLDLSGAATLFPEHIAGWITFAGFALMFIKQGVMWLGDLLDNGKQDGSFKVGMFFMLVASSMMLMSCGNQFKPPVFLAPDCLAAPITYQAVDYYVGRCGKDRTIVQYRIAEDENYRAIWTDGESIPAYYVEVDGKWRELGAKEANPPPVPDEILKK